MTKQDEANVALVALVMDVKHTDTVLYQQKLPQWNAMADDYHNKLKEALND